MVSNYNYNPGRYFMATFATTYLFWFAGAWMSFQDSMNGLYMLFMLPGMMAPFAVSAVMAMASGNRELKRDFIDRLFNPGLIRLKTMPAFLLIMPLSVLASMAISLLFGAPLSQFQFAAGYSFSSGLVPVLLLLMLAACFEELGWREYAFDSLQSRYNLFTASIVFSLLWSLWHFPLIFVNHTYQYEVFHQSIWYGLNFFISIIPMGIIISWIYLKNGKSVIAAILFHFIINISQETWAMTQTAKCVETLILALAAAAVVAWDREMFFDRKHSERRNATRLLILNPVGQ